MPEARAMIRKIPVVLAVLSLLGLIFWLKGWWIPNRPDPGKFPIRGIAVSHDNGVINWEMVGKAGVKFAFIRATEGSEWQDARFSNNWREAENAGVIRGGYHFFSTASSGEAQALNFISMVPAEPGTLPPVINLEFNRAKSRMGEEEFFRELSLMRDILQRRFGAEPIICTTKEFHEDYLSDFEIERLWAKEFRSLNVEWARDWTFWEFSSRGRIPGIRGPVKLNVYRGSGDEFRRLLGR